MPFYDIAGMAGAVLILGAYLLLQVGRLDAGDLRYSIINGLGAAFIVLSLCFEFNLAAFVVEIFWLAISIVGIANWLRRRRSLR